MPRLPDPIADPIRLAALRRAGLLDSPPDAAFDSLAAAASQVMEASTALVSLVDEDRQFFKSAMDPAGVLKAEHETPLALSLCRYAVASLEPLVLPDARSHPGFRDHPAVQSGQVAAYAGFPIVLHDGQAIGTICVLDNKPRQWEEHQIASLGALARDAAELIARQTAAADARARHVATKAGLGHNASASGSAAAAEPGLAALSSYLEQLDRRGRASVPESPAHAEDGLAAAVLFYLRQVDSYVSSLTAQGASADGDPNRQNRLRGAVVGAEAGLLRALEAFDSARAGAAQQPQQGPPARREAATALRDRCAAFLEAEGRRSRASLLFRRSMAGFDETERAVLEASAAEEAMRLALREYGMRRG